MKKNISINISGIIFHIEEDGYDLLKGYLDAINKYFSSYEDSDEIVADIEGRIAEIFLEKLTEDKQVISKEDVEELIQTMGQVADFEAMESEDDQTEKFEKEKKTKHKQTRGSQNSGAKKWERDTQRQLIAGVAAGLAHTMKTDPIWIRGLFVVLFFAGGIGLILYPILWIFLPGNDSIPENNSIRKLFRDPDDRVLGGVSAGLSKYFNTSTLLFRVLFILFAFSGFGIATYIVLWIITPKANSLTDKMQMTGEKVTITNIDSTIKKQKEEELNPKGENTFTKALLFPFRLIGRIFSGLGKALSPIMLFLVAIIRVFIGAIIALTGVSAMFSILACAGVLLGFYSGDYFVLDPELVYFPFEVFRNTIPGIGVLFLMATVFIPFLYVFIAGVTIMAKRRIMSTSFGWSVLGIWFISVIGSFALIPNVVRDFRDEGIYRETDQLSIQADTLIISVRDVDYHLPNSFSIRSSLSYEYSSEFTDLDIRPSNNGEFKVEKRFRARGRNLRVAEENAQKIEYNYEVIDSEITFDSDITFSRKDKFYFQEMAADLYIPINQPFKIDRSARDLIRHLSYRASWREIYRNTWMFDQNKDLVCLSCDQPTDKTVVMEGESVVQSLNPFTSIDANQSFEMEYFESEQHKIELQGPALLLNNLEWTNQDGQLKIDVQDAFSEDWSRVKLKIYGQELEKINLERGADFTYYQANANFLSVVLEDNSKFNLNGNMEELELKMLSNSRADLSGNARKAKLITEDESRIYGYDLIIEEAEVIAESESRTRLNVKEYLTVKAFGFSSVRYKGNPNVDIIEKSRNASVSKY